MTRYILKKDYPNHKIGDIITSETDNNWRWEDKKFPEVEFIPLVFYPQNCPDWWQKIEEEKSLEQYEAEMLSNLEKEFKGYFYTAKRGCPRIYWTEVLRVIAEDLNKKNPHAHPFYFIYKVFPINQFGPKYSVTSHYPIYAASTVYFVSEEDCQKAIDLLGENIKYLFND